MTEGKRERPLLGYICKYVPVEALQAAGADVCRIEPEVNEFSRADTLMHANVCSFVRAVLEDFADHDYDGMILTTCCDSSRRLYDTLRANWPDRFFYMLDLPHKINDFAATLYEKQIGKLLEAWKAHSGLAYDEAVLREICANNSSVMVAGQVGKTREKPGDTASETNIAGQTGQVSVGLVGARPGKSVRDLLREKNVDIVFDMTCTGAERNFPLEKGSYATLLLNQIPCMRMADASGRNRFLADMSEQADGIIYHTVKFCDIYSYEYAQIHKSVKRPVLKLETDATAQSSGQIRTRLEAFLEALSPEGIIRLDEKTLERKQEQAGLPGENGQVNRSGPMIVMGIDSGSTSTNAVLLNENKEILASAVLRTGAKSVDSAGRIRQEVLDQAGLKEEDVALTVSTGYGRVSIPFADSDVTEISCHAKGAHFLNPQIRTILDIGGQDSKAIRLDEDGNVKDFVMNDKCAAGTGRFLEMMARTLEIPIEELGPLSLRSTENLTISSMCTVFAESEVISLIAQNKEAADIAHGIHEAIVSRALSLIRRVGAEPGFMMTGGVARNEGVISVLEKRLDASVWTYEEPEIVGALGAALFGLEEIIK